MKRRILFLMVLSLWSPTARAQTEITVSGVVLEEGTGKRVSGADVSVVGGRGNADVTDSEGKFSLTFPTDVKPGTRVRIRVVKKAYETYTQSIAVSSQLSIPISLKKIIETKSVPSLKSPPFSQSKASPVIEIQTQQGEMTTVLPPNGSFPFFAFLKTEEKKIIVNPTLFVNTTNQRVVFPIGIEKVHFSTRNVEPNTSSQARCCPQMYRIVVRNKGRVNLTDVLLKLTLSSARDEFSWRIPFLGTGEVQHFDLINETDDLILVGGPEFAWAKLSDAQTATPIPVQYEFPPMQIMPLPPTGLIWDGVYTVRDPEERLEKEAQYPNETHGTTDSVDRKVQRHGTEDTASAVVGHKMGVLKLTFQDSAALTPARTERISRILNEYYDYLTSEVGLELHTELPPIGVSPKGAVMLTGGVHGAPPYYSHIIISEDSLNNDDAVRAAYSFYMVGESLSPNPATNAPQEGYSEALWVFACYFASSFGGKKVCLSDIPSGKWSDTMWEVRQEYGKNYADKVMGFTLRMWPTSSPGQWKTFDQFFMNKLMSGEVVMNGDQARFNALREIAKRHGVQLE